MGGIQIRFARHPRASNPLGSQDSTDWVLCVLALGAVEFSAVHVPLVEDAMVLGPLGAQ